MGLDASISTIINGKGYNEGQRLSTQSESMHQSKTKTYAEAGCCSGARAGAAREGTEYEVSKPVPRPSESALVRLVAAVFRGGVELGGGAGKPIHELSPRCCCCWNGTAMDTLLAAVADAAVCVV